MKLIAVTGSTGSADRGAGPAVARHLIEAGYAVRKLDWRVLDVTDRDFRKVDLTHYGDTFAALAGCDAVVHLAAQAEPDFDHFTGAERFHNNALSTFNVFQAAAELGMEKIVWGSSETVLGFPFDRVAPTLLPTDDERPPVPENAYAMAKTVCEDLARHMNRRYSIPILGLRFSNIHYDNPEHPTRYDIIPDYWKNPRSRMFNLWGYVDVRDVAQAVQKALESPITGAEVFTIAAADTIMRQANRELLDAVFPDCRLKPGTSDHETLIGISKAREMLGYAPQYSWRDILDMD
jgi:nucleoside-diphosphate-sugar epimerase